MVNIKSDKYSVKDIADLLNISVQTVHFYEKKGLIHPLRNPDNNYREYSFNDLSKLYYSIKYNRLGLQLNEFPNPNNSNDITSDNTSISDLKKIVKKRKEQIQIDTAICQYIEDSICEEEAYWNNPDNDLQIINNLHLYTMNIKKCLKKEYTSTWKSLIPISSMMSSWNVIDNQIILDNTFCVLRKQYLDMIQDQIHLPLNKLDELCIPNGIQIIKKINPNENYEKFISLKFHELKNTYPSLKNKFYIIPLLSVFDDTNNTFTLVKILFES